MLRDRESIDFYHLFFVEKNSLNYGALSINFFLIQSFDRRASSVNRKIVQSRVKRVSLQSQIKGQLPVFSLKENIGKEELRGKQVL